MPSISCPSGPVLGLDGRSPEAISIPRMTARNSTASEPPHLGAKPVDAQPDEQTLFQRPIWERPSNPENSPTSPPSSKTRLSDPGGGEHMEKISSNPPLLTESGPAQNPPSTPRKANHPVAPPIVRCVPSVFDATHQRTQRQHWRVPALLVLLWRAQLSGERQRTGGKQPPRGLAPTPTPRQTMDVIVSQLGWGSPLPPSPGPPGRPVLGFIGFPIRVGRLRVLQAWTKGRGSGRWVDNSGERPPPFGLGVFLLLLFLCNGRAVNGRGPGKHSRLETVTLLVGIQVVSLPRSAGSFPCVVVPTH